VIDERRYLQDTLYDWVAAAVAETGRTEQVIWRNGKGPRPVPPFVSIEFVGSETPGLPNYSRVKVNEISDGVYDDGEQIIRQFVRKTLTMYAFGEGCIDLLETIKASIYRDKYINFLRKKGFGIIDTLNVIEGPEARDTEIECSAHFDFVITFIRIITDDPGWIEQVEVSSEATIGNTTIKMMEDEE